MCPTRELANQVAGEIEVLGRQGHPLPPHLRRRRLHGADRGHRGGRTTSSWALRAASSTISARAVCSSTASGCWSSTRPTSCSRWASGPTCARSTSTSRRIGSPASSRRRSPRRCARCRASSSTTRSSSRCPRRQLTPQEIEHFFIVTTAQEKEKPRADHRARDPESAIIFCNTKDDVRYVTAYLQRRGFDADQISGDLTQTGARAGHGQHQGPGKLRFLVATDVAARGIDISDLTHVISFARPRHAGDLRAPHRAHRSGRQGGHGDLPGVGPRHRQLPLPPAGQQDQDRRAQTPHGGRRRPHAWASASG